jgi:hypothetical protein
MAAKFSDLYFTRLQLGIHFPPALLLCQDRGGIDELENN